MLVEFFRALFEGWKRKNGWAKPYRWLFFVCRYVNDVCFICFSIMRLKYCGRFFSSFVVVISNDEPVNWARFTTSALRRIQNDMRQQQQSVVYRVRADISPYSCGFNWSELGITFHSIFTIYWPLLLSSTFQDIIDIMWKLKLIRVAKKSFYFFLRHRNQFEWHFGTGI